MAGHIVDWQSGKSIPDINRHMLENQLECDVSFLVGEEKKKISAHKYVLVSRSSVFYAMLCGPLSGNDEEPIVIPDIDSATFTKMLK